MLAPRIKLSPQGPELSRVVAGVWRMGEWNWSPRQRQQWMEDCLALGVSSFDHADIYGGYAIEALFGEVLRQTPSLRDRMQLVSKCGIALSHGRRPDNRLKHYNTSAEYIIASVEASLQNLATDHLDLLLIHRPDPLMDADEVAEAFTRLHQAGKVQHFGTSNFGPAQFDLLHSRYPLVTNQIECSLLHMNPLHDGTLDQAQKLGCAPMIWSPLAGGRLFRDGGEREWRVRQLLEQLAPRYGVAPATIAYMWLLQHPSRPLPLTGSARIEAMRDAVAATALTLERQDWYALWQASTGHEVP